MWAEKLVAVEPAWPTKKVPTIIWEAAVSIRRRMKRKQPLLCCKGFATLCLPSLQATLWRIMIQRQINKGCIVSFIVPLINIMSNCSNKTSNFGRNYVQGGPSGWQLHFVDFYLVVWYVCLILLGQFQIDTPWRQHGGTPKSKSTKYSLWPDGSPCTLNLTKIQM